MKKLIKQYNDYHHAISYGNMFLIGNGQIGYRGTLEEYDKTLMPALNLLGVYDQYLDKWRESINMPNPFKVQINNQSFVYTIDKAISHKQILDINKGLHSRITKFNDLEIKSERFIPFTSDNKILFKYQIKAIEDIQISVKIEMDLDIYEINGPHFKQKEVINNDDIYFKGTTNENKELFERAVYLIDNKRIKPNYQQTILDLDLKKGQSKTIYAIAKISLNPIEPFNWNKKLYQELKKQHIHDFLNKWKIASVDIIGDTKADFGIKYSIYHLLILGSIYNLNSIPARGLSGQTYKGAIFWDTEIFLLPFYTLTNPLVARNLLTYRIRTLPKAIEKAKEFGYAGAFYAWEAQEDGRDACSLYNVTDAITNKPIRTYFKDKQIHISNDILYALFNYAKTTNDLSILDEAIEVMKQVAYFNMSYATYRNEQYHFDDVIGPDEYHERVNDNAFTNYLIKYTLDLVYDYLKTKGDEDVHQLKNFIDRIYLPKIENNLLIEQFTNYFKLEDITVNELKKRLKHQNEYLGGSQGIATPTKVIKQADVITLLALFPNQFGDDVVLKNFQYYYPYTEHGSSLSSSMYSLTAARINERELAYQMFLKSALIDLGEEQKMYAGGIYIGGTHPASAGGAYLSVLFGFCGLSFMDGKIILHPRLPKKIKQINFSLYYLNKLYKIIVNHDGYEIMEA